MINAFPALAAFFVPLAVYLRTVCPTVWLMDSGEFALNAATLGVCHPPGYPTYCLLGKLFTILIPFGSVAFRVNAMSAFFGAAASLTTYFLANRILNQRWIALSCAWMLAFSPALWSQAVVAEVWTLNLFLMVAVLWLLVAWSQEKRERLLQIAAFVYGLSLTNHLTMTLLLPAIGYFVLATDRSLIRSPRRMAKLALLMILGLTPYVYLPIRAAAHPPMAWGNPVTLGAFWHHVSCQFYRSWTFSSPPSYILSKAAAYGSLLLKQFPLAILWLAPIGVVVLRRTRPALVWSLVLVYVVSLVYALNYRTTDTDPYYIPGYLVCVLLMGAGWTWLMDCSKQRRLVSVPLLLIAVLIPLSLAAGNFKDQDLGQATIADDFVNNLFLCVERRAMIVHCPGSFRGVMDYVQCVERKRPDVLVVERTRLRNWSPGCDTWCSRWYVDSLRPRYPRIDEICRRCESSRTQIRNELPLRQIISENIGRRPIYLSCDNAVYKDNPSDHPILQFLRSHYRLVPKGIVYRILPRDAVIDKQQLARDNAHTWRKLRLGTVFNLRESRDPHISNIVNRYSSCQVVAGQVLRDVGRTREALSFYQLALTLDPTSYAARKSLADCYVAVGDLRCASKELSTLLITHPGDKALQKSLSVVQAALTESGSR